MTRSKKPIRRALADVLFWSVYFAGVLPFLVALIIEFIFGRIADGIETAVGHLNDLRCKL